MHYHRRHFRDAGVLPHGKVHTVDEAEVMELAQVTIDRMLERTGLQHLLDAPENLWRAAHY